MIALSAVLHLAAWAFVTYGLRAPELDLAFELPMDVELGVSEAIEAAPLPAAQADPGATPPAAASGAGLDGGAPADAGRDAETTDASSADAGRPRTQARDAGAAISTSSSDGGLQATLPPGTQIAVRVDMERIRRSPIANDVRTLLAAIPDWQALLAGSGIDPVDQLERLLIATPNLQREKIVLAGRYLGGEQVVFAAVERLAASRGESAAWRDQGNVRVAPWLNQDSTPRVIALVGPAHFTISRAEDLPRVLAIAAARASGQKRERRSAVHPAEALLSMEENEGLSIEVEGVSQFVRRGRRGVPARLRLAAQELPKQRIELRGRLFYADRAQAADARDYVSELRDVYARNALVSLLGLSDPLEDARIELADDQLRVTLQLSAEQTRLILGYVRELLAPPAKANPSSIPGP